MPRLAIYTPMLYHRPLKHKQTLAGQNSTTPTSRDSSVIIEAFTASIKVAPLGLTCQSCRTSLSWPLQTTPLIIISRSTTGSLPAPAPSPAPGPPLAPVWPPSRSSIAPLLSAAAELEASPVPKDRPLLGVDSRWGTSATYQLPHRVAVRNLCIGLWRGV